MAEGQINAVDGSRLLSDESAQVDGVVVPLVDVLGLVLVQGKCFLVNQASGATQFVGGFGRVGLEESQHVLLEDAHHAQVHRVEVDGAEGDEQALGVGQDGGIRPEFHLRFEVQLTEGEGVRRAELAAFRVADAFVQVQRQFTIGLLRLVQVGVEFVGFHLEDGLGDFLDFHQPFQILRGVQRGGEHDFQPVLRCVRAPRGEEAEDAPGGDGEV